MVHFLIIQTATHHRQWTYNPTNLPPTLTLPYISAEQGLTTNGTRIPSYYQSRHHVCCDMAGCFVCVPLTSACKHLDLRWTQNTGLLPSFPWPCSLLCCKRSPSHARTWDAGWDGITCAAMPALRVSLPSLLCHSLSPSLSSLLLLSVANVCLPLFFTCSACPHAACLSIQLLCLQTCGAAQVGGH